MRAFKELALTAVLLLLLTPSSFASDAPPEDGPWKDVWEMSLRGQERYFVTVDKNDFLWIDASELAKPAAFNGQEIAVLAKVERAQSQDIGFYELRGIKVHCTDQQVQAASDGDNFILFGTVSTKGGTSLKVSRAYRSKSDAEIIQSTLDAMPADDFNKRMTYAQSLHDKAAKAGNRTFWEEMARKTRYKTIAAAANHAARNKDTELIAASMDWAIKDLNDIDLAAKLASAEWIIKLEDDKRTSIDKRMRDRRYTLYEDAKGKRWMTQRKALSLEFNNRFEQTNWRDAEGYFKIGKWVETYADVLDNAGELAHKAYQAGLRADETHNGIRRMLGLRPLAASDIRARVTSGEEHNYKSKDSNIQMTGPAGWQRNKHSVAADADASWTDMVTKTSFIAVNTSRLQQGKSLEEHWKELKEQLSVLPQVTLGEVEQTEDDNRIRITVPYSYKGSDSKREGVASLLYHTEFQRGIAVRVVYKTEHATEARNTYERAVSSVRFFNKEVITPETDADAAKPPTDNIIEATRPPDNEGAGDTTTTEATDTGSETTEDGPKPPTFSPGPAN